MCKIKNFNKRRTLKAEFGGSNIWKVFSGSREYELEVFFLGYSSPAIANNEIVFTTEHGLVLEAECNCPASRFNKSCVHSQKVLEQYQSDFSYIFPLFNLSQEHNSFKELNKRIAEIDAKLNTTQKAVA